MIDCASDSSAPPPRPWITRKITSSGNELAKPHKKDATVKMAIEVTK